MSGMADGTDGGDPTPDMDVSEGTDVPDAPEVEDQMVDEALAGEEGDETELDVDALDTEEQPAPLPPQAPPQQMHQPFTPEALAQALKQAISPLVPKAPPQKQWWDDPKTMQQNMLANPEKFHQGLQQYTQHHIKAAVEPLSQVIEQQNEIISYLYNRSAERPEFASINQQAEKIAKDYNLPYKLALRMANDQAAEKGSQPPPRQRSAAPPPRKGVPVRGGVPRTSSAPNTRQGTGSGRAPTGRSTDFGDIMKEVVAEKRGK